MKEKSRKEYFSGYRERSIFAIDAIVFGIEGNIILIHACDATIAYGNPVRILPKVLEYFLCSGKGSLAINNPIFFIELIHQFFKLIGVL